MSAEPLQVAVATDARYVPHTAAMLRSLVRVDPERTLHVHLLHGGDLTAADLAKLASVVERGWAQLQPHLISPERIAGLPAWDRIPVTMWHRILLPALLPELDRILYLDVDVLVADSIAPLFDLDLSDSYVGAVTNVPMQHMLGHAERLGLPGPEHYFNSGVLLMNLALMRRDGCTDTLLRLARERAGDLLWPDQDALNLVLAQRRLRLHPRWNLMNSIRQFAWSRELLDPHQVDEAETAPAIVHFEGPDENKPWHILCENPYRKAYFRCRRETPWPRVRRDGVTLRNVVALGCRRAAGAVDRLGGVR